MSADFIRLTNSEKLATEQRSRTDAEGSSHLEHFQRVAAADVGRIPTPFVRYFEDGASSIDLAVDASGADQAFSVTPGATEILRVQSVALVMQLAAAAAIDEFGDLAALGSGLLLKGYRTIDSVATEVCDLFGGQPATSNLQLVGAGAVEFRSVDSTFALTCEIDLRARPLRLSGAEAATLQLTVRDNLSALGSFIAIARGVREDLLG